MKAFILNGTRSEKEFVHSISLHLIQGLQKQNWQTEILNVWEKKIGPCRACSACGFKTPGICAQKDDGSQIARLHAQCDMMVFLSAVTFGGYSAMAKKALERTLPNVHPDFMKYHGELHHKLRYSNHPFLLFVGWQPRKDEESAIIFEKLAERNAVNFQASHRTAVISGCPDSADLDRQITELLHSTRVPL